LATVRLPERPLLDYRLPDSNDLTLLANIRRLSPRSPVILDDVLSHAGGHQTALDLGVHRVMSKPFEMPELEELPLQAYTAGPR
jgi:CheY-like chemotaxis protein